MIVHITWPKCVRNDFIKMRILKMHRNDITFVCMKIWRFKLSSVSFSGVNAILKKVGLCPQNDWYLISNSPYNIKVASKLKLYPMEWSDMQINYIICIFINTDENFRK